MYMDRMISVGKAANGYVIECCVPFKPEKKKESEGMVAEYPGSREKQYIAKDSKELATIIDKLIPMLDEKYTSADEFDRAFNEYAGVEEDED